MAGTSNGTGGTMTDVMRYFGMKATEFRTEWKALSETERDALKEGVGKVSLNADKMPVTDEHGNVVTTGSLTY